MHSPALSLRRIAPLAWALAFALAPRAAHAADVDGVYGRFRADSVLSLEAGGGVATVQEPTGNVTPDAHTVLAPVALVTARARYLDMAGLFLGYQYAFGTGRHDALSVGLDIRPLMLARIFQDWEQGPRWLDLMLDSIGLEMGLGWVAPGETWHGASGLAWIFGGGVEAPLVWGRGNGLTLRFAVRWTHVTDADVWGTGRGPNSGESVLFTVSLVGRVMARLGLIGIH